MDSPEETSSSAGDGGDVRRRRTCTDGCGRPINVCLCHALPSAPVHTATQVVILHHPHERRHKLATVPILAKCLRNCEIIVGRKLKYGQSELLDSLHDQATENPNLPLPRAVYLFPGPDALPFGEVSRMHSSLDDAGRGGLVLIVFDGTWKHAKEMLVASLSFISKFAVPVCLDFDAAADGGTIFDSELILRKEPFAGCVSTMEAVARCLHVLEPDGPDIASRIIEVLRAMVSFQACYLKPLRPRTKLLKNENENAKKSLLP
ncbi:tRNA-uridine aminocarboxypropyltransferase 2 isoform X2 [Salvia hispanica]|uniref:tRNA-uridine aminocarboxypropyltransferase 2 isoform X2 n=1 Tax=Salvia hispanica TaxID=49212 RepID=UPI002009709E|nr:tRNA-uridine aminocarboxypropyltransferase 2 isoform X2 [Salvia hispanica]